MSNNNSEIPCSACQKWNAQAKSFACNPNKCQKLSEWLFDHAQLPKEETIQVQIAEPAVQYII